MLRCKADHDVEYTYGYDLPCGSLYDGDCGADCMDCLWSYPSDDPDKFGSANGACRCPPTSIKELTFGDQCPSSDSGDCGSYCRECMYSWKTYEEASQIGVTKGTCRCKNWW